MLTIDELRSILEEHKRQIEQTEHQISKLRMAACAQHSRVNMRMCTECESISCMECTGRYGCRFCEE